MYFLLPAGPQRITVSSNPATAASVTAVLISVTTSASTAAHRASIPCTNPAEGALPPVRSAISRTHRSTGTCW
jgi:hypothetical protein